MSNSSWDVPVLDTHPVYRGDLVKSADGSLGSAGEALAAALPAQSGSAIATNWTTFDLRPFATLTPGAGSNYSFTTDDLELRDWPGNYADPAEPNDFTIGLDDFSRVAIRSARGGVFQATLMAGSPDSPVLDAAFHHARYLWLGVSVGADTEGGIFSVGGDLVVPVLDGALENQQISSTTTTNIGYTPPGGVVLSNFGAALIGGVGDDSVPIHLFSGVCVVYQIA